MPWPRLARDPNRFLATIQIGITLAGFLASAAAAVSLAEPLEEPLGFLGGAARPVSIIIVTLVLSFLTLVFGELAPKRVAMQRAEGWGLLVARRWPCSPRSPGPSSGSSAVDRPGGAGPRRRPPPDREEVTEEELREMVTEQPSFTDQHRTILSGAFEIAGRTSSRSSAPGATCS